MELLQSAVGARVTGAIELSSDLEQMRNSLPRVNHLMENLEWWRFESPYIANLLMQLRDAAYDAEDVLAEFDYYQLKQKMEGKNTIHLGSISFGSFMRNLVSNFSSKVRDLQNKLNSICDKLESELGRLGLPHRPNLHVKALQRETTSFLPEEVFGYEEHVEKVLKILIQSGDDAVSINEAASSSIKHAKRRKTNNFSILPIVGMGGMGKTTLAQLIYNDERVKNYFDLRIWVCVSDYFNLKKITKEMIVSGSRKLARKEYLLNNESGLGFGDDPLNLDSLQHILKEKVASRRYLLVLDDVWHDKSIDWEILCNPLRSGIEGSMILITTRMLTVANAVGTLDAIELRGLPDDIFWKLFKKCAFGSNDTSAYLELETIGKKIASKLKGCPLAAKTLGGILSVNMTIKHWKNILETELWQLKQDDESFLAVLRVSYLYLPAHLKRCFLICSLFPKDFYLNINDLTQIWTADGIICHENNTFYYEKGCEYFGDLRRSFILCYDWKYLLHDHMHDLAKSLSLDMCYCQEGKDWSLRNHNSIRHLSVVKKPIELIDKEIGKCEKLRSLLFLDGFNCGINRVGELLEDNGNSLIIVKTLQSLFSQLPYLRLLDLRNCQIEELAMNIGNLKLLFYLNIRNNRIRSLPDSLCELYNLEVIDVEGCPIESFPSMFSKLINLRIINMTSGSTPVMSTKILRIGMLTCLEELKEFEVLEEGHKIDELKNMTRLSGSLRITNLENVEGRHNAAQACLNNKKHLTELTLSWSPDRDTSTKNGKHFIDEDTIEGLQPNSNLKFLDIRNYRGRTGPSWLQTEKLLHLHTLDIIGCSNLESLENLFVPHQYSSLQYLCIVDCVNLLSLSLEGISSSSLTSLKIKNCPRLNCPTNFTLPSSLKDLYLYSCGEFDKSLPSCLQNSVSLKCLDLINCQHINSLPRQVTNNLSELVLSNCAELQCLEISNSSTLVALNIEGCPMLIQHDPSEAYNKAPTEPNKQLNFLCIDNTSLLNLSFLRTPPCSLRELEIRNSQEERMFVGDLHYGWLNRLENLMDLTFRDCFNLELLPEELHTLVTLTNLTIENCPRIQSLPEKGLPPSAIGFYIGASKHSQVTRQLKQHNKAREMIAK